MYTSKETYSRTEIQLNYGVESNHLGNVLATISAKPILVDSSGFVNYRTADVMSVSDYFPFGSTMPGRSWDAGLGYRFGFNAQEKTDEIAGTGNHNTALFWEYDTRTGRRWNLDPKPTVGISDYTVFLGNPIRFNDPNGDAVPVEGTRKERRQFRKMLEGRTGNKYKYDKDKLTGSFYLENRGNTSNITTDKGKSGELSALVSEAILSDIDISINLTSKDNTVAFDDFATAALDLSDFKKAPDEFQAGMLGHIFSERLNCPGKMGYSNLYNRTYNNLTPQDGAHFGYAIPTESRIVTDMLGISYAPRNITNESYEGAFQEPFTDISGTYNMTKYSYYTEIWQYGSKNYKMIMGVKNEIIPASMGSSRIPRTSRTPLVGLIYNIK